MLRIVILAALLSMGLPPAAPPAWADSDQNRAREAVKSGKVKPLKAILKAVRRQVEGQVLDAELVDFGGVWLYRIRVLTNDGRVLDLAVDGQSGQIIDVRPGG